MDAKLSVQLAQRSVVVVVVFKKGKFNIKRAKRTGFCKTNLKIECVVAIFGKRPDITSCTAQLLLLLFNVISHKDEVTSEQSGDEFPHNNANTAN